MLQSKLYIPTMKEVPKDAQVPSHILMLRGGYISQTAAGIYTYLPLGLKLLKKIENIVREEMDSIGAQEILMPALAPASLWMESGRWDEYGAELMRLRDRKNTDFALGATHEEVVVDLMRNNLKSYKSLPQTVYQIQTKFRDELRPRYGLLRGREFLMKDSYSFNESEESLDNSYKLHREAYINIMTRLGLDFEILKADSGAIGGSESEEFMVLSDIGEDFLVLDKENNIAYNLEVAPLKNKSDEDKIISQKILEVELENGNFAIIKKGIEVGHIFKLGTKYSEIMNAKFQDKDSGVKTITMGCYGIGVSRLMSAIIESNNFDGSKIAFPKNIAPYQVHIIATNNENIEIAKEISKICESKQMSFLIDDRNVSPGVKFKDADLIGCPYRIVVGRDVSSGIVEFSNEISQTKENINIEEIENNLK